MAAAVGNSPSPGLRGGVAERALHVEDHDDLESHRGADDEKLG